jgi:hypothetical protein
VVVGTENHASWLTANEEEQKIWLEEIARTGFNVTPVL